MMTELPCSRRIILPYIFPSIPQSAVSHSRQAAPSPPSQGHPPSAEIVHCSASNCAGGGSRAGLLRMSSDMQKEGSGSTHHDTRRCCGKSSKRLAWSDFKGTNAMLLYSSMR
uniref:Uncharacterized protein n=1 Tax=Hyaloperonospora arabidopsidis (strain Emoy2) TaxID=559515 RepID=M4B826_HYAAE